MVNRSISPTCQKRFSRGVLVLPLAHSVAIMPDSSKNFETEGMGCSYN